MKNLSTKRLAKLAVVSAIYVALTLSLSFMAYGNIQFRIAEALMLLCFYKKDYGISLILGCLIVNLFSPMGLVDVVFGTLATVVAVALIYISPNIYVASLMPVVSNAIIVGAEIWWAFDMPFAISAIEVAAGEFVCVSILGVVLFKVLEKNSRFMRMIRE
ncbi:MAG: QueT transporter family protein [Oscillospiraceae bacterium]|nr:QueT transporter family protein [Oscillospiraceae bacterium]